MKKIHKLFFSEEPDFALLGIGSHVKGYKLCWHVNKKLQIDLEKKEAEKQIKKEGLKYTYVDNLSKTEYNLFFNQIKKGYLLPEQKNINFFLQIKNPLWEKEKKGVIEKLKKIPEILLVFELDLKTINPLFFE